MKQYHLKTRTIFTDRTGELIQYENSIIQIWSNVCDTCGIGPHWLQECPIIKPALFSRTVQVNCIYGSNDSGIGLKGYAQVRLPHIE